MHSESLRLDRAMVAVPNEVQTILPHPTSSVATLLAAALPHTDPFEHLYRGAVPFSKKVSNLDVTRLRTLALPHETFLKEAVTDYPEAISQAATSFTRLVKKEAVKLPIWVIRYWEVAGHTLLARRAWESAREWLKVELPRSSACGDRSRAEVIQATCRELMDELAWDEMQTFSWDEQTPEDGRSLCLSSLLSNAWIGSDLIDHMLQAIATKVNDHPEHHNSVFIASRQLVENIITAEEVIPSRKRVMPSQRAFAERLKKRELTRCFFVENVHQNHWIVVEADIQRQTIRSADSLSVIGHGGIFEKALKAWVEEVMEESYSIGTPYDAPQQKDMYSCGICCIAFITHQLFGDPLWSHASRNMLRAEQFIMAANVFIAQVSTLFCLYTEAAAHRDV